MKVLAVLRRFARWSLKAKHARIRKQSSSNLMLIDVGASYFLHKPWIPLLLSKGARLTAVDPNAQNLGYLDSFPEIDVTRVPKAVASKPGKRTLYVTNVDSGSSLFPPNPSSEDFARDPGLKGYLFPVVEKVIDVSTLDALLAQSSDYVGCKIDTQGAELEILRGAEKLLGSRRILSVEAEVSLLPRPIMLGASNLVDLTSYLSSFDLEMIWIRPTVAVKSNFKMQERQAEADVLFMMNKEKVIQCGPSAVAAYRALLAAYGLAKEIRILDMMLRRGLASDS